MCKSAPHCWQLLWPAWPLGPPYSLGRWPLDYYTTRPHRIPSVTYDKVPFIRELNSNQCDTEHSNSFAMGDN